MVGRVACIQPKGLYPKMFELSVWLVFYGQMDIVKRDDPVLDKITQNFLKISYLFLRSGWHLYKKGIQV